MILGIHVSLCMGVPYRSQRETAGLHIFLRQSLSLSLELTIPLEWLALESQESSCLCYLCFALDGFHWVLRIQLRSSPTELSLEHTECSCYLGAANYRPVSSAFCFSSWPHKELDSQNFLLGQLKAFLMLRSETRSVWTWDCCGQHRQTPMSLRENTKNRSKE